MVAAVHRGWIALKDALTGDDAEAVLEAAVVAARDEVKALQSAS